MRRLDRYLLRESVPPLLFGLLLYSGLAVVSVTLPRMQWIVGTPILRLSGWLALQLPTALVQTLPIALVLAVLLAFGRLATDNELLAMQAGAVPLRRSAITFVAFGVLATGAALALNQWVLPVTNARVGSEYWRLTSGGTGLFRLAGRSLPVDDFLLRFGRAERAGDAMLDVRVERWSGDVLTLVRAERGNFTGRDLTLRGYDVTVLNFAALDQGAGDPTRTLNDLVRVINRPSDPNSTLTLTMSQTEDDLISRFSEGGFEDTRSLTRAWRDAHDMALGYRDRRQAAVSVPAQAGRAVRQPHAAARGAAAEPDVRAQPQRRVRPVAGRDAGVVPAADVRAALLADGGAADVARPVAREHRPGRAGDRAAGAADHGPLGARCRWRCSGDAPPSVWRARWGSRCLRGTVP